MDRTGRAEFLDCPSARLAAVLCRRGLDLSERDRPPQLTKAAIPLGLMHNVRTRSAHQGAGKSTTENRPGYGSLKIEINENESEDVIARMRDHREPERASQDVHQCESEAGESSLLGTWKTLFS